MNKILVAWLLVCVSSVQAMPLGEYLKVQNTPKIKTWLQGLTEAKQNGVCVPEYLSPEYQTGVISNWLSKNGPLLDSKIEVTEIVFMLKEQYWSCNGIKPTKPEV